MINHKNIKPNQIKKVKKSQMRQPVTLSRVDIIVPFHGQYAKVTRLLTSLWATSTNFRNQFAITQSMVYNLCLVDDASPNQSFLTDIEQQKYPGVICLRNDERMGFGASLKRGFEATDSPAVVFLNSDCEINDLFWLRGLAETFARHPKERIGVVSARLDNSPGGDPRVRCEGLERTEDVVLKPQSVQQVVDEDMYVPLVCALCRRDMFAKIGGFVKCYPIGWYEDLELACRMKARGYVQAISGTSRIHHEGGCTINDILSKEPGAKDVLEANFSRCCDDLRGVMGAVSK